MKEMGNQNERTQNSGSNANTNSSTSCLELEPLLAEYAEGRLEEPSRQTVERHLAGCAACGELLAAVSVAVAVCRQAGEVAPPPRLVARILERTTGELSWKQRLRAWVRPVLEPRLALGTTMALISFSIVLKAFDVNLQQMTLADLSPVHIYWQLDRKVHLAGTRAVKYYRDLRIVYEIQTQLQAIRETAAPPEPPRPRPQQQQQPAQPQPPAHNKWSRQAAYVAAAVL